MFGLTRPQNINFPPRKSSPKPGKHIYYNKENSDVRSYSSTATAAAATYRKKMKSRDRIYCDHKSDRFWPNPLHNNLISVSHPLNEYIREFGAYRIRTHTYVWGIYEETTAVRKNGHNLYYFAFVPRDCRPVKVRSMSYPDS